MGRRFQKADVAALAAELNGFPEILAPLIHASRCIGSDPGLVLHGGGNTSAKTEHINLFGENEPLLYVKGSGMDMAAIGPEGFAILRLKPIRRLKDIPDIPDAALEDYLACQTIRSASPDPSLETLLHAFLPHRFIFHCHADALLILTHQKNATHLIPSVLGKRVLVVPYAHPGFPLARAVVQAYEKAPESAAALVLNHGVFTFSDHAENACNRMLALVKKAETFIQGTLKIPGRPSRLMKRARTFIPHRDAHRISQILRGLCAGKVSNGGILRRYVLIRQSPELMEASLSPQAAEICRTGVLTPDHAIRTRNRMVYLPGVPEDDGLLKKKLAGAISTFQKDYGRYLFDTSSDETARPDSDKTLPVLFLVSGIGLFSVGETLEAAKIAADIGERTAIAKRKGSALGSFRPIPEKNGREMELWPRQLKKRKAPPQEPLSGQAAFVTGGGGAIGFGIARSLLAAGAAVGIADIDPPRLSRCRDLLIDAFGPERVASMTCDVTDAASVRKAFEAVSLRFGGVDLVVPNAGIAHVANIEDLDPEKLDRVIAVNFKGAFTTIQASIPVFKRQGTGGNIVLVSSKNVFDPGAAFSAYSASKAAAHQMAKIAAMELAGLGVRVNMVNPDAVFGDEAVSSGLWDLVGPERMAARGLSPQGLRDFYRQRSLLKVPILAEHVGNAVVFFASGKTPTTGASLPIDGGIPAAFPR